MNGYKHVFDKSIQKYSEITKDPDTLFESFRSEKDIYGFIDNGDTPPDREADSIAKNTNLRLYESYRDILKTRVKLGYANSSSTHSDYTNLDSRHIMMSVLLFSNIQEPLSSIVEIGGGFGNWLTLNRMQSFKTWTILDLPHLCLLQNWFLEKQGVPKTMYEMVSAFNYTDWASAHSSFDLVIGSHSVSELLFDVFYPYFMNVISKSKYFFYCYHNTRPTPELIRAKLQTIQTKFKSIVNVLSEQGNVTNSLYVRI
jgi:hypothetical protein